jgi:hypothetical protein
MPKPWSVGLHFCFCCFDRLLDVSNNPAWTWWLGLLQDYTRLFAAFCELHVYARSDGRTDCS